jgi:hypothetical protein
VRVQSMRLRVSLLNGAALIPRGRCVRRRAGA